MANALVVVKPWCVPRAEEILRRIDEVAHRFMTVEISSVELGDVLAQFAPFSDKPFYPDLVDDYAGKSLVLALYEGNLTAIGSKKREIRFDLMGEIPIHPKLQKDYVRNALHSSASDVDF